ncbi:hypothetical protein EYF80_051390 [Liparis tanakae]|uniref:Uncharacterized protein n=1 Tax=Liparis tanakae TaxID=230148 RepID=A0A4Z2FC02_9TELE|nr:hypothetical protein EYF80_051390 [Liparis tanakae]
MFLTVHPTERVTFRLVPAPVDPRATSSSRKINEASQRELLGDITDLSCEHEVGHYELSFFSLVLMRRFSFQATSLPHSSDVELRDQLRNTATETFKSNQDNNEEALLRLIWRDVTMTPLPHKGDVRALSLFNLATSERVHLPHNS